MKLKKSQKKISGNFTGENELKSRTIRFFESNPSVSIKFNVLFRELRLHRSEKSLLRTVLQILIEENFLFKKGKYYEPVTKSILYEGKIILDKEMDYAVESRIGDKLERLRVRKRNLQTALVDDIVQFSIIEFADTEDREALVESILKRSKHLITGNLEFSSKNREYAFVIPDDKKFRKDVFIPVDKLKNAKNGDKVICEIVNWEYQDLSPEGKIIEVLGKAGEVETEFKALIKKYGLSKSFPKKVRDEVSDAVEHNIYRVNDEEILKRVDLRDKIIFTIDPEDAKDFDDAIHLEKDAAGNYSLGVHIADVGYYVPESSELDKEAFLRGTSVYLMNDVVPMLPEKLSNDVCSLKEKVERFTFSVIINLDPKGNLLGFDLNKSVIKSKKRFTYEEVQKILDSQKGIYLKELNMMNDLHKVLYKKRLQEGSLDFQTQEVKVDIDENGNISSIKPKERLESMRIIEDFMLLANKCVTLFIERKKTHVPFIYRIHDIPDKKKMKELAYFVKQFGINLNPDNKRSIQNMLEQIRGRDEEYLINDLTIRSMSKALYSEENIGHYGLGFEHYTHFTSPIRRYPDLVVHRILYESLNKISNNRIKHYKEILPEICKQSTDMEMNAVQAERDAVKILQVQFLEKHLGEIFNGIISGITEFGLYIEITKYLIEGMVRLRDLKDDYYILDEKNYRLIGRRRRKIYRIGDKVKVKIYKLDKEKKWIDFQLI